MLPAPRKDAGKPLMQALQLRRSIRQFSPRPLPLQVLSDLLWAAYGVNRPSGDRTAPYWRHIMVIDVYAAMADGVWLYDPKQHALRPHLETDIRAQTGLQDFVATAPLNLVYVAHGERMKEISPEERRLYASVDAAFAGQNVYLYCASEGLATVFRGAVDYEKLKQAMQLERRPVRDVRADGGLSADLSDTDCYETQIAMSGATDKPLLVFAFAFAVLWLSAWIGASFLRKGRNLEDEVRDDFGVIQGATLTLLALIIGFTFSMAVNRYDQRKNYEEAEANAIGTEYVRAGLLPAADTATVRKLLLNYLDQRVLFYKTRDGEQLQQINTRTAKLQTELWSTVQAVACRPADTHCRAGGCGHERRIELAGLHPGCVVEPYPAIGVGLDAGDRHLLQRAGWLWGQKG